MQTWKNSIYWVKGYRIYLSMTSIMGPRSPINSKFGIVQKVYHARLAGMKPQAQEISHFK